MNMKFYIKLYPNLHISASSARRKMFNLFKNNNNLEKLKNLSGVISLKTKVLVI